MKRSVHYGDISFIEVGPLLNFLYERGYRKDPAEEGVWMPIYSPRGFQVGQILFELGRPSDEKSIMGIEGIRVTDSTLEKLLNGFKL